MMKLILCVCVLFFSSLSFAVERHPFEKYFGNYKIVSSKCSIVVPDEMNSYKCEYETLEIKIISEGDKDFVVFTFANKNSDSMSLVKSNELFDDSNCYRSAKFETAGKREAQYLLYSRPLDKCHPGEGLNVGSYILQKIKINKSLDDFYYIELVDRSDAYNSPLDVNITYKLARVPGTF